MTLKPRHSTYHTRKRTETKKHHKTHKTESKQHHKQHVNDTKNNRKQPTFINLTHYPLRPSFISPSSIAPSFLFVVQCFDLQCLRNVLVSVDVFLNAFSVLCRCRKREQAPGIDTTSAVQDCTSTIPVSRDWGVARGSSVVTPRGVGRCRRCRFFSSGHAVCAVESSIVREMSQRLKRVVAKLDLVRSSRSIYLKGRARRPYESVFRQRCDGWGGLEFYFEGHSQARGAVVRHLCFFNQMLRVRRLLRDKCLFQRTLGRYSPFRSGFVFRGCVVLWLFTFVCEHVLEI